jgi:ketol-acid reductoisomerase
LKLIVDLFYKSGISGMYDSVSDTAEYGGYTRGPRIIDQGTRERMKKILDEIQSGEFAKEWIQENENGRPRMNKLRKEHQELQIEAIGKDLRKMMAWLK